MSSTGKKFFIVCFSLILVLGISSIAHAQSLLPPQRIISYCGAVCVYRDTATGACPAVKADTYFTVVNPAYKNWLPVDCPATVWLPCMYISAKIVLYDHNGTKVGAASAIIPPKGHHNFSLAEILIRNERITLDGILKKYTVEITWSYPCITDRLIAVQCPIPDIPVRVQVKEIIFDNLYCIYEIRDTVPSILTVHPEIIKTWSETSLGPQILYPKGNPYVIQAVD